MTQKLKTDFVAIGGGGAGLAAALTAAETGADVIVLEKLAGVGGSTSFAEGLFAAESSIQRARNIDITKDESFKKHTHGVQPFPSDFLPYQIRIHY